MCLLYWGLVPSTHFMILVVHSASHPAQVFGWVWRFCCSIHGLRLLGCFCQCLPQWVCLVQRPMFTATLLGLMQRHWDNTVNVTMPQWFLMFPWKRQKWLHTSPPCAPVQGLTGQVDNLALVPHRISHAATHHIVFMLRASWRVVFLAHFCHFYDWSFHLADVRDRTGVFSLQAAAGACTCAYVPAIWLKEMASLLLPAKKLVLVPLQFLFLSRSLQLTTINKH